MSAGEKRTGLAISGWVPGTAFARGIVGSRVGRALLVVLVGVLMDSGAACASSTSIDISAFVTNDLTTYTGGNNYPQNGGPLAVGGIPFTLATIPPSSHTAIIQNGGTPETFSIPVNLSGVTAVYSLANSANGACGTTVGELDIVGASSGTFVYFLTEGNNIRDHFEGGFCNSAPGAAGTANFGPDRLDMQRIILPPSFAGDTLLRIDFKGYGLGGSAGRPFLAALTASTDSFDLPALSPWALASIAAMMAVLGLWTVRRFKQG